MSTVVVIQAPEWAPRGFPQGDETPRPASLLVRMIERVRAAETPFKIPVATSTLPMSNT